MALFTWLLYRNRYFFHDDAFISLRYARNLIELGDLSWNPGERVEGYTNFLHLLAVAGLMKLGNEPLAAARVVGLLSALALLAALFFGLRRVAEASPRARAVALFGTVASTPLAIWSLGGLETVTATALLAWGLVLVLPLVGGSGGIGRACAAGIFFALAYLTRPDSLVVAAISAAAVALAVVAAPGARRRSLSPPPATLCRARGAGSSP